MNPLISHYAIHTGSVWTLVCVDSAANQCRVTTIENSLVDLYVGGTTAKSIRRAARDGAGRSFTSLEELMASTKAPVTRRADLDC